MGSGFYCKHCGQPLQTMQQEVVLACICAGSTQEEQLTRAKRDAWNVDRQDKLSKSRSFRKVGNGTK